MSDTDLAQFGKIDQTPDATGFLTFLDAACAEESFKDYKRQLLEWMLAGGNGRMLDVGCGPGDDVREMAGVVVSVVGVDNSKAMIDEANRRAVGMANVSFQMCEAGALPFPDGHFVATRADRSLMHVGDSTQALCEMVRVTRSGGRVVVFEVDFETTVIDTPHKQLARNVIRTWCDGFRDGWLGRRMPGLFAELGLQQIQARPHALSLPPILALPIIGKTTTEKAVRAGTITADAGNTWLAHLAELQRTGRFVASLTGFLVTGIRL